MGGEAQLIKNKDNQYLWEFLKCTDSLNMLVLFFSFYHSMLVKDMLTTEERKFHFQLITSFGFAVQLSIFVFSKIDYQNTLFLVVQICYICVALVTGLGFALLSDKLNILQNSMRELQQLRMVKYKNMFNAI